MYKRNSKTYTLFHTSTPIMTFDMDSMFTFDNFNIIQKEFLPMQLLVSEGRLLERWLSDRALDISRSMARGILKELKISMSKVEAVVHNNAMCMTDYYWINYTIESFEEHLRFRNLGDQEYIAVFSKSDIIPKINTSLTSIGSFDKVWKGDVLYKSGGYINNMAEIWNYRLCELLNLYTAVYFLDGRFVCSNNFTDEELFLEHYESFRYLDLSLDESELLSKYNLYDEYIKIITIDAITSNPDRHSFNFGVLRCVKDGSIVKLAPNFDNNLGWGASQVMNTAMLKYEFDDLDKDLLYKFSTLDLSGYNFPSELQDVQQYVKDRL